MSRGNVNLTINGRAVKARAGTTVLEAAREAGATVPSLCYNQTIEPAEACRLCLVRIEGSGRPVAACATMVGEGMIVNTAGAELARDRQTVFDLMLADHYGDCRAPCSQRCPAGIDIQGYIALIARGYYLEAARLIRRSNPLPLTCGRVCPHPCESQCRRGRVDEPVNINHLKRFCCDIAYADIDALNPVPAPPTGKRVAVVGGGPAGLTASYYLALAGHSPTIFEAAAELGGMLRYGIPAYRLPKEVLDREIEAIVRLGVEVHTGVIWGEDFSVASLLAAGFDAVFLGTGAAVNRELDFLKDGHPGVNYGTCFLGQVALGQDTGIGKRVVVIGGGNTAMDCARTAVRLGADEISVLYRRSRKEMPAQEIEVDEAEEEGVTFELCVAPVGAAFDGPGGRLSSMTFVRMDLCALDDSGRARPEPIEGSEFEVACDTVIVAVGQVADSEQLAKDRATNGLLHERYGTVVADYFHGTTATEGIFAAGDLVSGPATVVEAIGGARRAASAMDRHLMGLDPLPGREFIHSKGVLADVDDSVFEGRASAPRAEMPVVAPEKRKHDFEQVELGLGEDQARAEAERCLACGCMAVDDCRIRSIAHDLNLRNLVFQHQPPTMDPTVHSDGFITIEDGKCVVCRTCERACAEYHGRGAVQVRLNRIEDLTDPREHQVIIDENCDQCGLCAEWCPTGALSHSTHWTQPGPLPIRWRESICTLCPLGCLIEVGVLGNHLVRVRGKQSPPAMGHLCRWGRYDLARARDLRRRVTRPMVRQNGGLQPVSWEKALSTLAEGVLSIGGRHGHDALAGLTLGRSSLEELYLFGKLVRMGLFTNNLDYVDLLAPEAAAGEILADSAGGPPMPPYEEIETYPTVILVGINLSRAMPLLEAACHRQQAAGGRLVLLGRDPVFQRRADEHHDLAAAGAWDQAAQWVAEGAFEGRGRRRVLILGAESSLSRESSASYHGFLSALAAGGRDIRFAMVPAVPAGRALARAGISPSHYPGHHRLTDANRRIMEHAAERPLPRGSGLFANQILLAAQRGEIKGMLIQAGYHPAWQTPSSALLNAADKVEFLAVIGLNRGPLVERAQVALPKLLPYEQPGTHIIADGRIYEAEAALEPPPGTLADWRVLVMALKALGGPAGPPDLVGVQSEMIVLTQSFAEC